MHVNECAIFLKKFLNILGPLNLYDLCNVDLQCKVLSECEYELLQVKTLASFIGVHDQIHVYSCSSVHSTCFDSMYFFFVLDCLIYVDIIPL